MMRYRYNAVANGLGTDHPIPDLPFVDDSHIPLDDPKAIEAIGRRRGTDMWGRQDRAVIGGDEGGWLAYTTDPYRHDLAWCVRFHPEHGRSVVLYRNIDASSVHTAWWGPPLLYRSGGYWWDGTTWFRPSQIWDVARERYVSRPVPAAVTVHAADLLQGGRDADPNRADTLEVQHVDADKPQRGRWLDDLALWASRRGPGARSLSMCAVRLAAPELTGEELIGVTEMAEIAGVAASTLRAYISRGENDVPLPQATVNGRNVWARVVAQEWAEQRNRSPESVGRVLFTQRAGASNAAGITELWNRFTASFFSLLWDSPGRRKHWALRWRTETAVREIAEDLGWEVAASLDRIIPTDPLAATIRHAVLDEIATGRRSDELSHDPVPDDADWKYYGIQPQVARMLDWFVRHHPATAAFTIGEIIGEATDRFDIPRKIAENTIETALTLDSELSHDIIDDFLARIFDPDKGRSTT
jgi:hypothetical protein